MIPAEAGQGGSGKRGIQRTDEMRITVEQWRTKMDGSMNIPAEAVEAAAWALYERDHIKGVALGDVRRALEAAAPYLMAEAWDEGASWMNDSGANTHDDNPYRNRT